MRPFPGAVLAVALAGSVMLTTSPALAGDDCPASTMRLDCDISTTAAVTDTMCPPTSGSYLYARGYFDQTRDVLGINMSPNFAYQSTQIRMVDRIRLVGLPAGTPINLTIRLATTATLAPIQTDANTVAQGVVRLLVDGVAVAHVVQTRSCVYDDPYITCTDTGDISSVQANVVLQADQDYLLVSEISGLLTFGITFPGAVRLDSALHFDGLPPGVTVVSCYDAPVPARGVTWGQVKTRYR